MSMSKVWIEEGCTACGLCESICSEVFEVQDEAIVKEGVDLGEYEEQIKEAAEDYPVEVIKYQ